jgi:hypothetical protein
MGFTRRLVEWTIGSSIRDGVDAFIVTEKESMVHIYEDVASAFLKDRLHAERVERTQAGFLRYTMASSPRTMRLSIGKSFDCMPFGTLIVLEDELPSTRFIEAVLLGSPPGASTTLVTIHQDEKWLSTDPMGLAYHVLFRYTKMQNVSTHYEELPRWQPTP